MCNILGIKERTLKDIEYKKMLQTRLENKGYKYIDKFKEGRKVYYNIELVNNDKEVYSNLCKYVYNTNKEFEFAKYFISRSVLNDMQIPKTSKSVGNIIGVTGRTVLNWDSILVDKDIIRKNDYYYMCVDNINKTIKQCSKQEYINYCKELTQLKEYEKIKLKHVKGLIDADTFYFSARAIQDSYNTINDKYYYRIKRYINNKDNQLYIDTLALIKSVYNFNKQLI